MPSRDQISRICLWVAITGLIVRVTVKDAYPAFAIIYYALPFIVISGLLGIASVTEITKRRWTYGVTLFMTGLIALALWIHNSYIINTPHPNVANTTRILLWNIGRKRDNASNILNHLIAKEPDVIALVESGDIPRLAPPLLPNDYQLLELGGGLTVFARGNITDATFTHFGYRNRIGTCTVHLGQTSVPIMLVDIDSNPFVSRKVAMQNIEQAKLQCNPVVILGDFNTPSDSVWFNDIRKDFAESFEAAGSGIHATWPCYLPLWAIDHIWIHRSFTTCYATIISSVLSDHCMVQAEIKP